jgi:hypothetical protein
MRTYLVTVAALSLVSACASSAPPPASTGEAPSAASATPAENPAPSAAVGDKPSIESQREPFIQGCMARAHSPDYCDCGFQQFREVFKEFDPSKPIEAADPRLKALQEKTQSNCASKLDEEQVKANFLEGCVSGDERKSAYCKCAWPALRKNLSVPDFIGDADTPRFFEAKKAMVAACKGKLPVEIAKNDFMTGCTKAQPEQEKRCTCLWTKIKAKFAAEELAAGTADIDTVPGLKECK